MTLAVRAVFWMIAYLGAADDAVNYGVVDEIARRVVLTRGRVLAVRREDIPGSGPAAAILRYPV
jgi:hypothetical protein